MSTEFINDQWRLPNAWNGTESNVNKQSNYSMDFNGTEYITAGLLSEYISLSAPTSYTVSAWIKTSSNNTQGIVGSGANNSSGLIFRISSGEITFGVITNVTTSRIITTTANVNDGNWHHVVGTYDSEGDASGNTLYLYVDGTQIGSNTGNRGVYPFDNYPLFIGAVGAGNSQVNPFNGKIDGVSIFNYALTDGTGGTVNQIAALYGSSSTGIGNPMSLSPKPVAYYPLGDQDAFNGADYLVPNSSLKDYVFDFGTHTDNKYISINNTFDSIITGTNFTISSWINLDSVDVSQLKFIFTNETLQLTITNKITTYLRGASGYFLSPFNSNTTLTTGEWYNVVLIKSGSDYTYYLNGSPDGTTSNSTSVINSSQTTSRIGMYYNPSTYGFDGFLSNAQIFNSALPATGSNSVETLYNNGSPLTSMSGFTSLQAWYKLDASEVYDSSTTEWSIDNNQNPSPKSSLSFNNGSTRILFDSNSLNITSALTVSGWFRIPTSNTGGGGTNIQFFLNEDQTGGTGRNWSTAWRGTGFNYVWFAVFHNDGTSSVVNSGNNFTPNDGKWHHYFGTWDGTTNTNSMKLYIDNNLVGQDTPSQTGIRATSSVGTTLGAVAEQYQWNFEGELSNWAVWNSSQLSELPNIYNQGVPAATYTNTPLGWWKLNNKTSGINDLGSGGNNGVIGTSGTGVVSENAGFVSKTAGNSTGMTQANLVQSDLSFTSDYSPYALDFDSASGDAINCGNDSSLTLTSNFSVSAWMKSSSQGSYAVAVSKNNGNNGFSIQMRKNNNRFAFNINDGSWKQAYYDGVNPIDDGKWHHVVGTFDGSTIKIYVDNIKGTDVSSGTMISNTANFTIAGQTTGLFFNGQISNVSYWNTALTLAQITEVYNEGVPSNLNNHSAYSNLVSWWQLGSNSSFNSTLNQWTCIDEKGTNTGESSQTFNEDDIVDGVGSYANGLSSGMGGDEVIGDAPYSTANSLSVNMEVLDRVTDTPS